MKARIIGVGVCLALLASLLGGAIRPAPAVATDATTSLTVTKYNVDGTTILAQQTIDYLTMESTLPPQGDGTTHYFMQGPTFDENNLWDPGETVNLKDKGAVKGTDVKDLCQLLGENGAYPGDTIQIKASDGFSKRFPYDSVYNPPASQGKMVVCWYTRNDLYPEGAYVPTFAQGMQLVFMPADHVFGHQNMHDCLPEEYRHYFDNVWPSSDGLSVKYISEINIGQAPWTLRLVGPYSDNITQDDFESGVACVNAGHGAEWLDTSDNSTTWRGLPLWLLCGWADDANPHGVGAFNDALAREGYTVRITAADNTTCELTSQDVKRNDDIIVANTRDGEPLPQAGDYPLRLVGDPSLLEGKMIGKITKIELVGVPAIDTWQIALSGATTHNLTQAEFEDGVICTHVEEYTDASGTWKGLPLWLLCGWVDDDVQHGPGAFNDALAARGYDIVVTGAGGSYTFDSRDVARNDDIIVANTLNDSELAPDEYYPLKIVGADVTGSMSVSKITRIELRIAQLKIPAVVGNYSTKGTIKFYDWKGNKATPLKSGTLHITEQGGQEVEGCWEPDTELGWSDNITVKGFVGPFVRDAKGKIKNKPRLSLLLELGEYDKYPSSTYATYILNGTITMDKKTELVKSLKVTINGWGEFGDEFTDVGGPSQGQFEGKFTAKPVPIP